MNAIIDAYEGLAVVRTVDASEGLVEFWVPCGEENTLRMVLHELGRQVEVRLEEAHGEPQANPGGR